MLKRFVVLTALAVGSTAIAHADSISGFFAAFGNDSFTLPSPTTGTITFAPGTSTVEPAFGGTFATYLTAGNPLTFASGPIPYTIGNNTPPAIPLFTTTENGETFTFTISNFNAGFLTPGSTVEVPGAKVMVPMVGAGRVKESFPKAPKKPLMESA